MTLGERIERALEVAGMSVKDLERALAREEVRGGSYSNLQRYKQDKKKRPSAELLHGIAEATGVNSNWLVNGEKPMTEEEGHAQTAMGPEWEKAVQQHSERIESERAALREAAGASVSPVAFAVFLHTWSQTKSQHEVAFADEQISVETFAQALMAPFHRASAEIGEPDFMELEDYIVSAAPVIGRALGRRWRKSLTEPRTVQQEDTDG